MSRLYDAADAWAPWEPEELTHESGWITVERHGGEVWLRPHPMSDRGPLKLTVQEAEALADKLRSTVTSFLYQE